MKKARSLLLIAILGGLLLPSCKKNYECVCTLNGTEMGRWSLGKQSRDDAKDACDGYAVGPGAIWKCELE